MAKRHDPRKHPDSFAASAAIFLMAALFSVPALASTPSSVPCPNSRPSLDVSANELVTATVSHDIAYVAPDKATTARPAAAIKPVNLLAPRAEAAIRKAFRDNETTSDGTALVDLAETTTATPPMVGTEAETEKTEDDARIETPSGMTTRFPGVSDDDLSRFKKQMFRRDI